MRTGIVNLKRPVSKETGMGWEEDPAVQMEARFVAEEAITDELPEDSNLKIKIMSRKSNDRKSDKRNEDVERIIGAGKAEQDANADQGGTTDMDSKIRKTHSTGSGSGISTKREVSGSDFDGQVMDQ